MAAECQCWAPTSGSDLDSGCEEAESQEPGEDSGCPAIHRGGACLWLWGKAIWMSYDRWMFVFDCRFIYCSFLVILARPLCLTSSWTQCSRKLHRGLVSSSASFYPQVHKYTSLGSREQPLPCVVAVATHSFLMFPVGWDKPAAFAELATGCCGESLSWEIHPLSPFAHSPKHRWASEGLAGSSHTNRCLRAAPRADIEFLELVHRCAWWWGTCGEIVSRPAFSQRPFQKPKLDDANPSGVRNSGVISNPLQFGWLLLEAKQTICFSSHWAFKSRWQERVWTNALCSGKIGQNFLTSHDTILITSTCSRTKFARFPVKDKEWSHWPLSFSSAACPSGSQFSVPGSSSVVHGWTGCCGSRMMQVLPSLLPKHRHFGS